MDLAEHSIDWKAASRSAAQLVDDAERITASDLIVAIHVVWIRFVVPLVDKFETVFDKSDVFGATSLVPEVVFT